LIFTLQTFDIKLKQRYLAAHW